MYAFATPSTRASSTAKFYSLTMRSRAEVDLAGAGDHGKRPFRANGRVSAAAARAITLAAGRSRDPLDPLPAAAPRLLAEFAHLLQWLSTRKEARCHQLSVNSLRTTG
jgi:hypothetical protein